MKVWIHILIFAVSTLAVLSQDCPSEHFSAVFVSGTEQTIDTPEIHPADPDLFFFKNVMRFTEEEIYHIFEDAINFFNSTFGIDFSASPPNEQNERFFENAIMSPFNTSEDINFLVTANNWIRNGNTHSNCYKLHDGGIRVTFSGDQTLYGSYGGADGKPTGNMLVYGFFRIDACQQSPVIIHIRCDTPFRIEPVDGTIISSCIAYNRVLGYGRERGYGSIKPDPNEPGKFRVTAGNIFTF